MLIALRLGPRCLIGAHGRIARTLDEDGGSQGGAELRSRREDGPARWKRLVGVVVSGDARTVFGGEERGEIRNFEPWTKVPRVVIFSIEKYEIRPSAY